MVWQDYELIPTKRVNKDRITTKSIFFHRLYLAMGGHSCTYLTLLSLYSVHLWHKMGGFLPVQKPFMLLGVGAGSLVAANLLIGSPKETGHLLRNYVTYRKEFAMIKDELYYQ